MLIDVTDLFVDPDVGGGSFSVLRRLETVNNFGEAVTTTTRFDGVIGSVYPSGDNSLVREEAYTTGKKSIEVVTSFRLQMASRNGDVVHQPDIIEWRGDNYIVRVLDDFTQYGAGFVKAGCLSYDFADAAPEEPPQIGAVDFSKPQQSGMIGAVA